MKRLDAQIRSATRSLREPKTLLQRKPKPRRRAPNVALLGIAAAVAGAAAFAAKRTRASGAEQPAATAGTVGPVPAPTPPPMRADPEPHRA